MSDHCLRCDMDWKYLIRGVCPDCAIEIPEFLPYIACTPFDNYEEIWKQEL